MELGVGTTSGSLNVGIGLGGSQTDACTFSKCELTFSSVLDTLVTSIGGPIRPSGPNGTSGCK